VTADVEAYIAELEHGQQQSADVYTYGVATDNVGVPTMTSLLV
jgi:hypothetical protein